MKITTYSHRNHLLFFLFLIGNIVASIAQNSPVGVIGAMHHVMREGQLQGRVLLDTLSNKQHLYGVGPLAQLQGELLVLDGKSYVSRVGAQGEVVMEESFAVEAPFFVYAQATEWVAYTLPETVINMATLEGYLSGLSYNRDTPFVFRLEGEFDQVKFHVQNLPEGTIVRSMKDAHTGQLKLERTNVNGSIVGFYSRKHQTIFTHQGSYLHMHYIAADKKEMGHVDAVRVSFAKAPTLYIAW